MVYFDYLVIREKSLFYERNISLLFSYLYRVMNCAKIQGGILIIKPTRNTNFSNLFLE